MKKLKFAAAIAAFLASALAIAQSSPGLSYGTVPTPGQWNNYFSIKQDYTIPGNLGNVLQSNGSSWYSAPLGSSSFPAQSANTIFSGPSSGSAAAPTFRALVGADLPYPSASSLGGTQSLAPVAHNFVIGISGVGVPTAAQPAFTDLSGSATAAQMPAFSGDISTSAGSTVTTLATVNSNTGSFGSSTAIPNFTVSAKGLITAAGTNAVIAPAGTLSGAGTGVTAALTNATNASGGLVTYNGALGTPTSGVGTNLTGTATGLTVGASNGIKSATTTVNCASATAPSAGQVLTATSSTACNWQTPQGLSIINGYINGLTLSNDGTTPNTVLDIAAGYAADSSSTLMMTGTTFKKSTAGTWVAGTGNNGMGTGLTVAASTWYHAFAIINSSAYDVYFDTSITAANAPAGTTQHRYIGSFKTDASSHILAFTQIGQKFIWASPPLDYNSSASSIQTVTLSVPPGISVYPLLSVVAGCAGNSSCYMNVCSGLIGCTAAGQGVGGADGALVGVGTVFAGSGQITTTSNTSSQISLYENNNGGSTINTSAYINPKVAPIN